MKSSKKLQKKHLHLSNQNPVFLSSLGFPWKDTFAEPNARKLNFRDEAKAIIGRIDSLIQSHKDLYEIKDHIHLPIVAPSATLARIECQTSCEQSELLAIIRLKIIEKLLPVYLNATRIIQGILTHICLHGKLSRAKIRSKINENADFEIDISGPLDPSLQRLGPHFLTRKIYQAIEIYRRRTLGRPPEVDGPRFEYNYEENEERAYIELLVGHSKIVIRDFSSSNDMKNGNSLELKNAREECTHRTRFLTSKFVDFIRRLGLEREVPSEFCVYLVKRFFRLTETRLLESLNIGCLRRIQEERQLWREFMDFYMHGENLEEAPYPFLTEDPEDLLFFHF